MSAAAEGRSAWSRSSTRSWTVIEAIRKRPRLGVARPRRKEIVLRALQELLAGDQAAETGATEPEFRRRNQDDAGPVQAARPAPGCGRTRFLEVHHLRPRSRGGSNDPDNLVTLCSTCHGTRTSTRGWRRRDSTCDRGTKTRGTAGPPRLLELKVGRR